MYPGGVSRPHVDAIRPALGSFRPFGRLTSGASRYSVATDARCSSPAVASQRPRGSKAGHTLCPRSTRGSASGWSRSHRRAVSSVPPVASQRPWGSKARGPTPALCPGSTRGSASGCSRSHRRAVSSLHPPGGEPTALGVEGEGRHPALAARGSTRGSASG